MGGEFEEAGFVLAQVLSGTGGPSVMGLLSTSYLEGRGLAGNTVIAKHGQGGDAGSLLWSEFTFCLCSDAVTMRSCLCLDPSGRLCLVVCRAKLLLFEGGRQHLVGGWGRLPAGGGGEGSAPGRQGCFALSHWLPSIPESHPCFSRGNSAPPGEGVGHQPLSLG